MDDMKGHGFDLEATHLKEASRISSLFLGICIVYVWLITLGSPVVKLGFRHLVMKKKSPRQMLLPHWLGLYRKLIPYQSPPIPKISDLSS
jgi:hypothetical protein